MSNLGFVKIDRAIKDWRYKTKPDYVALWLHLIVSASHQDKKVYDTLVKRGCLLTSYEKLAKETGLSVQKVRTILKHLNGEELTCKSTNKNTLICLIKYSEYQGINKQTNKQVNKQITNNQQTTNNIQEYKEYKECKELLGHSDEFVETFERFVEHRKVLKKPLTSYGQELSIKRLAKMGDEETQIAILNQSIENGWQGLFALKEKPKEETRKEEELW